MNMMKKLVSGLILSLLFSGTVYAANSEVKNMSCCVNSCSKIQASKNLDNSAMSCCSKNQDTKKVERTEKDKLIEQNRIRTKELLNSKGIGLF